MVEEGRNFSTIRIDVRTEDVGWITVKPWSSKDHCDTSNPRVIDPNFRVFGTLEKMLVSESAKGCLQKRMFKNDESVDNDVCHPSRILCESWLQLVNLDHAFRFVPLAYHCPCLRCDGGETSKILIPKFIISGMWQSFRVQPLKAASMSTVGDHQVNSYLQYSFISWGSPIILHSAAWNMITGSRSFSGPIGHFIEHSFCMFHDK